MRRIVFITLAIGFLVSSRGNITIAQSLARSAIGSVGATSETNNIQLDFLVGEVAVVLLENPSIVIAQGLHSGRGLGALAPLTIQTEVNASSTGICSPEDSITFTVSATNAGAEPTFQWYINDLLIENETSSSFTTTGLAEGVEVKVQVVASLDVRVLNDSVFSETIVVDFSTLEPKITVANNTLTASEGSSYQWFLEDELLADTTQTITVEQSGNYQVEITDQIGCTFRSERVEVIVCTATIPTIEVEDNTLTASETGSYRWFLDGEALPDTTQSIEAAESGSYTVEVTDASGCSATSEALEINITGIEDPRLAREVLTYPNPVSTRLTVDSQIQEAVEIQIYSSDGLLMYENSMAAGSHHLHVALDNFSPGLYIIQLQSTKGLSHRKLIKR